jgi:putative transposase
MARPLRILYQGAYYHVMNRGRNRVKIFIDKRDYQEFLETVKDACALFHVRIVSYCLMGNHYHLLVHTPEGNLPRFMRHVNGVYTQRYNSRYRQDGSLFRGR